MLSHRPAPHDHPTAQQDTRHPDGRPPCGRGFPESLWPLGGWVSRGSGGAWGPGPGLCVRPASSRPCVASGRRDLLTVAGGGGSGGGGREKALCRPFRSPNGKQVVPGAPHSVASHNPPGSWPPPARAWPGVSLLSLPPPLPDPRLSAQMCTQLPPSRGPTGGAWPRVGPEGRGVGRAASQLPG